MSVYITESCIGCTACARGCPSGAITGEKKMRHAVEKSLCIDCEACGRLCPAGAVCREDGSVIEKQKKAEWPRPVISAEKCYACENCVAVCPSGALTMNSQTAGFRENYAVLSSPEKCVSCRWCSDNCQFGAISWGDAE